MKDQNDRIVSQNEITSLNLADLDVQELENRLELATLAVASPDSLESEENDGGCWCNNKKCTLEELSRY